MKKTDKKLNIFGIELERYTKEELSKELTSLTSKEKTALVFTPNSEMLVKAKTNKDFYTILSSADLLIPDGFGVYAASRILSPSLPDRLTGIEAGEFLLDLASRKNLKTFLLGGSKGVGEAAAKQIRKKYPSIQIRTHHGYFDHAKESNENRKIINEILDFNTDIVLVCLGSPTQEKWIYENASRLIGVSLLIGLGGSLDVWSGNKKRAPTLIRRIGLEWLYRSLSDVRRIKRLPALFKFPFLVLRERLSRSQQISQL